MDQTYWTERYRNKETGWDLGEITPPLKEYFDSISNKELKILIPGAGNGYEAEYLFQKGFTNVYLLDISELPLQNFKQRCPEFPSEHLIHSDFFDWNASLTFDLIIEYTFFCALPKNKRQAYFEKMQSLLISKGMLLGVWFNVPLNETAPPFGGNEKEYEALFTPYFTLKSKFLVVNSTAKRQGQEIFMELLKK